MGKAADVASSAAEAVGAGVRSAADTARQAIGTVFEETEKGEGSGPALPAGYLPAAGLPAAAASIGPAFARCQHAEPTFKRRLASTAIKACGHQRPPACGPSPTVTPPPPPSAVTQPIMPKGDASRGESPSTSGTTMNDRLRWK